jgi:hypothetical protein
MSSPTGKQKIPNWVMFAVIGVAVLGLAFAGYRMFAPEPVSQKVTLIGPGGGNSYTDAYKKQGNLPAQYNTSGNAAPAGNGR